MYCIRHIHNFAIFRAQFIVINSGIFRHIHVILSHIEPCCGIFRTLCNSCICKTLPYLEYWHIENPRYIQNSVKAYSVIFRTLCNACIWRTMSFRALLYSEFWHISDVRYIWNSVKHLRWSKLVKRELFFYKVPS